MPDSPSLGSSLLSLFWVLLCVLVVIGLSYWFTKHVVGRTGLRAFGQQEGKGLIKVIARSPLGKEQQLLLVQAGQKFLLLGVTGSEISNLAEFTPEEAAAWADQQKDQAGQDQQLPSFKEALQTVIKQRRKR